MMTGRCSAAPGTCRRSARPPHSSYVRFGGSPAPIAPTRLHAASAQLTAPTPSCFSGTTTTEYLVITRPLGFRTFVYPRKWFRLHLLALFISEPLLYVSISHLLLPNTIPTSVCRSRFRAIKVPGSPITEPPPRIQRIWYIVPSTAVSPITTRPPPCYTTPYFCSIINSLP